LPREHYRFVARERSICKRNQELTLFELKRQKPGITEGAVRVASPLGYQHKDIIGFAGVFGDARIALLRAIVYVGYRRFAEQRCLVQPRS
jgi:hypothetical protein